ncbi:MAG: TAXI family TRAP transporter solute-binding subunit [Woeseiaceae bacterium]|nr:TAXI family TRAP transporter solute-binding subunit [Woeseiaceae bacterium]
MNSGGRFAFLLLLAVLTACERANPELTLARTEEDPATTIAAAVVKAMAANGLAITVEETVIQRTDILDGLRSGALDLAIIEEPDRPMPGLVTIAPLYPGVLHVLHNRPDASDFATLLRGATVYAGPAGGAAQRLLAELARDFNVSDDEYRVLDNPWTESASVFFIIGGLLSESSIAQFPGYELFSFGRADDPPGSSIADGIVLKHHHLRPFVLPEGVYHTLTDEPVVTLSIRTVLAAREDFDQQLAYDIASTLFHQSQEISETYPLVTRELDERLNAIDFMLPLHEGTRRYLDRDAPGFIERYVDVLALYFTIIITVLSGAIALYRHRKQVRKDRVDEYYTQLLDIRERMRDAGARSKCFEEVLAVQREVLELLVEERIAADASLLAFVNLSNQMLGELASDHRTGNP